MKTSQTTHIFHLRAYLHLAETFFRPKKKMSTVNGKQFSRREKNNTIIIRDNSQAHRVTRGVCEINERLVNRDNKL